MTCVDAPLFLSYVFSVGIIFGFPFIYLSARKLGRALEEQEGIKEEGITFGTRVLISIAVAALVLHVMGFVPFIPC